MHATGAEHPQDVYADESVDGGATARLSAAGITLILDRTPAALARVYGLLCTVDLLPVASCCVYCDDDSVRLDLAFESVSGSRFERLVRKLAQLTECLEVRHTSSHRVAFWSAEVVGRLRPPRPPRPAHGYD